MDKPVIGIPELQSHSVSDALALVDSVEKKNRLINFLRVQIKVFSKYLVNI